MRTTIIWLPVFSLVCKTTELEVDPELGPMDANADCHFPFNYLGKEYNECTSADSPDGTFWCGTGDADTWESTGKWGHCKQSCLKEEDKKKTPVCKTTKDKVDPELGPMDANADCHFPFNYLGKEYSECTSADSTDGTFWCATGDADTWESSGKWGHCEENCPKAED